MEPLQALDASTFLLRAQLTAVRPDQWANPSACDGWTVHDVANHVLGDGHRYWMYLNHADSSTVDASRSHDYVGTDPATTLDRTATDLRAAFLEPDGLRRPVAHALGDITGSELLELRVLEQTLHAWDIAVGIEGDQSIPEALCTHLLQARATIDRLRDLGYYGADTPGVGSPQEHLLRATGRHSSATT